MLPNSAQALAPPPEPPEPALPRDEELEQSRRALGQLVRLLGLPEEWGAELARRELAKGRVWRRTR